MKVRIFVVLALAGAVMTAALTPSTAQTAPAAAPRTLSMNGQGEVKAAPDMAQVSAGVTTSAPTAAAALAANSTRMTAVFAAIKKLGVPEKNIQTVNFSISPQYTNPGNNLPMRLTGYQVNNEVSVRLDDVSKVGAALDVLVTAGTNQMNGISFGIKDQAPLMTEARTRAVADARAKAETYAKAAGVTLGAILAISENGYSTPRPLYRMAPMAMAAPAPPPVAAGEESVSANVSIVWEIH